MKTVAWCLASFLFFPFAALYAQLPEATPEHKVLQKDVGTWKATVKIWMTPEGKVDPNAEPTVSEGKEINEMLGPFWIVGRFQGEFAGMPFQGVSLMGYDMATQKYTGTWVDSFTPSPMKMVGTFDKEKDTLTTTTAGVDPEGNPYEGKAVVEYQGADRRTMTMYEKRDGEMVKSMQINYERLQ